MSAEQKVSELIAKGYKYPHDIEVLAIKIYNLLCNDKIKDKNIIMEFVLSVTNSGYCDIVQITYEYLKTLSENGGELLYEEYKKIEHLFDSINILVKLGVPHDEEIIKKADKVILDLMDNKKRRPL